MVGCVSASCIQPSMCGRPWPLCTSTIGTTARDLRRTTLFPRFSPPRGGPPRASRSRERDRGYISHSKCSKLHTAVYTDSGPHTVCRSAPRTSTGPPHTDTRRHTYAPATNPTHNDHENPDESYRSYHTHRQASALAVGTRAACGACTIGASVRGQESNGTAFTSPPQAPSERAAGEEKFGAKEPF